MSIFVQKWFFVDTSLILMKKLQNLANFITIPIIYFHFSDVFFKFMCQSCTSDMKETFEREKLPWYRRLIYKKNKFTPIYKPIGRI